MADQDKLGADWGDDELDAIVADYFAMLRAEKTGEPFVKAHHRRALMEQIGRTNRSVEFKHMNISAVLRCLGLPTIKGYKPKFHVQASIVDAVEPACHVRQADNGDAVFALVRQRRSRIL